MRLKKQIFEKLLVPDWTLGQTGLIGRLESGRFVTSYVQCPIRPMGPIRPICPNVQSAQSFQPGLEEFFKYLF